MIGCTPKPSGFDSDRDLIDYCEAHCRTPVALFHRSQIARICALAGVDLDPYWPEWSSVGEDTMLPLVRRARARYANAIAAGTTGTPASAS
jgi:hypothetical protein